MALDIQRPIQGERGRIVQSKSGTHLFLREDLLDERHCIRSSLSGSGSGLSKHVLT